MTFSDTTGPIRLIRPLIAAPATDLTMLPQGIEATTGATGEAFALVASQPRQPASSKQPSRQPQTLPEIRTTLRTHWKKAQTAARNLLQAAQQDDPMARFGAADDLEQSLTELWNLRDHRDINWQAILNHLQGAMRQFFASHAVEFLQVEQCRRIAEVVERYLGPATKTSDDLAEVVRLIEEAGADPYHAISGDPANT